MKSGIIFLLAIAGLMSQAAHGQQVVMQLPLAQYKSASLDLQKEFHFVLSSGSDGSMTLRLDHFQTPTLQQDEARVLDIPAGALRAATAERYGITGEVLNTTPSVIALEMASRFVPRADSNPDFKVPNTTLYPSDHWQTFELQFDRAKTGLVLDGLDLFATFYSPGTVAFRNLKLVQYPDTSAPVTAQSPAVPEESPSILPKERILTVGADGSMSIEGDPYSSIDVLRPVLQAFQRTNQALFIRVAANVPDNVIQQILNACKQAGLQRISFATMKPTDVTAAPSNSSDRKIAVLKPFPMDGRQPHKTLDWKSFFLGMLTTCLLLLVLAGARIGFRRWNQIRHAREMRRIASLDT